MDPVFDRSLVEVRRARAARMATPGADFLLQHVGEDLVARLAVVERFFATAVVIEDHADTVASKLRATGKVGTVRSVAIEAVREDATERLPLDPESVDLIVSPLNLHLVNDTPGLLVQIRRALRPDGLFLAAIPGAGTLAELRESLLAAEAEVAGGASPRVIPFGDVRDYGALLQRAGFALPVSDVDTLTVRYDTLFDLMLDLRAMGMTNPLAAAAASRWRAASSSPPRRSTPNASPIRTGACARRSRRSIFRAGRRTKASRSRCAPAPPGSRLADALGVREKKLGR